VLLPQSHRGPGEDPSEKLREAVADVATDHTESAVWRSAYLPSDRALALVADLPNAVKRLAAQPVERVAGAVGVPAPGAGFVGEVAASFVLEPVLGPETDALHGLEVAGVVIGVITAHAHLAVMAAKCLLHDAFGKALADEFTS
jgi:hypothetical protein